jgi:hypothetical protein
MPNNRGERDAGPAAYRVQDPTAKPGRGLKPRAEDHRERGENLAKKGIRVNGVASGPIWTPLIVPPGYPPKKLKEFGKDIPMGRSGEPEEVAPSLRLPGVR